MSLPYFPWFSISPSLARIPSSFFLSELCNYPWLLIYLKTCNSFSCSLSSSSCFLNKRPIATTKTQIEHPTTSRMRRTIANSLTDESFKSMFKPDFYSLLWAAAISACECISKALLAFAASFAFLSYSRCFASSAYLSNSLLYFAFFSVYSAFI